MSDALPAWYIQSGSGATLYTRHEAQKFARRLVESEKYRLKLQEDLDARNVAPAIEAMLWAYAYGRPVEQISMTVSQGQEDLSTLSLIELQKRAADMQKMLEDAQALEDAIPASFKAA